MKFLQENMKSLILLVLLVSITAYAMFVGNVDMVDKILLAVLTALDTGAIATKAFKSKGD